jgi:C1A family cysteine protease
MYFDLSRLFLYWQERNLEGTVSEDSGAYIRDGFKVMQKIGCASESYFPYDISKFRDTPTSEAVENAKDHRMGNYYRIMTVAQLKDELAKGNPVVMGFNVYESFESYEVAQTGIVPMPKAGEQLYGGHAVLAMGYKKINGTEYIICKNSWGKNWGDNGFFYMPMAFIGWHVSDMWTSEIFDYSKEEN